MEKGVLYSYLYWIPLGNTLPPIQRMLHEVPFSHIWNKCAETLHEGWDARRWGWGRRERTHVRDLGRIPKATPHIAFVQQSHTSEGGTWVNPLKKEGVPCHFQKRNLIQSDRIIWESDIYLGGKIYMTIDGSTRESLTITYYFEEKKWEYVYHTAKRIDNSSNRPSQIENLYNSVDIALSKCEADSILSSWGL